MKRFSRLGKRSRDEEIDEEIQSHLRMSAQDHMERGESEKQAWRSAHREFGNRGRVKEDARAVWVWITLERLLEDVKYAFRQMRRSPGFTAVAALTLGFGLSVNIAIFSMIDMFFLQPLPVKNADRLMVVMRQNSSSEFLLGMSWPDYQDYRSQADVFTDMLAYTFRPAHLSVPGKAPERTWIEAVSGNYFSLLGVTPSRGRLIQTGDAETRGRGPVVVLSYDYWQSSLGGDPNVVGSPIVVNGYPLTIIGITPPEFHSAQWALAPSAFVPATMIPEVFPGGDWMLENRHSTPFRVSGYFRDGVNDGQAASSLQVISQRLAKEYRPYDVDTRILVRREMLTRPDASISRFVPFAAAVFVAMAGLVLLIACANIANLMLSRALVRQREAGIRTAVGAPRWRLIRQLLTESIVLAIVAAGVGMLLAHGIGLLLVRFSPQSFDVPTRPPTDTSWLPVLYTLMMSVVAGVATGLVPALRATRVDVQTILKGDGSGGGRKRHLLRSGLVMAQTAVCVVVLVCGGLFVRSLQDLSTQNLGFRTDGLLMASVDLALQGYEPERGRQFLDQLTEQVGALPGVESVAVSSRVPFDIFLEDHSAVDADQPPAFDATDPGIAVYLSRVDGAYFRVLGVPLVQGRGFDERDTASSPRVAVVNQTFADRLWPGQNPLGKGFRWSGSSDRFEVVGISANGRYVSLGEAPRPYAYFPMAQAAPDMVTLSIRARSGDPLELAPSVRAVLNGLDGNLPVYNIRTMDEHLRASPTAFFPLRMGAFMAGAQGAVALLLALIGVFGVVAYSVRQQTREIGIRMALGARGIDVLRLVSRSGLRPALIGLVLGLLAASGLARGLAVLLYGLDPADPPVFAAVTVVVLGASVLACWLPGRRATHLNATEALRHE